MTSIDAVKMSMLLTIPIQIGEFRLIPIDDIENHMKYFKVEFKFNEEFSITREWVAHLEKLIKQNCLILLDKAYHKK